MHRVPFDNSYRAPYPQVSRVVRCDDLIFTSGQLDVDGEGRLQHEGDMQAETRRSLALLYDAVEQAGGSAADIAHLQVFYRNAGHLDETAYRKELMSLLPEVCRPLLFLTPIETFPKGIQVEVDAIARIGSTVDRHDGEGISVVRSGDLIFAGATFNPDASDGQRELDILECRLRELGSGLGDIAKLRFYATCLGGEIDALERGIIERFPPPGPVYTRLPLAPTRDAGTRVMLEVVAVTGKASKTERRDLSPGNTRQPPWRLSNPPAVQCGRYVFVGGQLSVDSTGTVRHADLIRAQIDVVMTGIRETLGRFDRDLRQVAKVNAYHQGRKDKKTWTDDVQTRANHYPSPGPASTGVEVSTVGLPGALITVDCIAVTSCD